jgi:hypothetical protein
MMMMSSTNCTLGIENQGPFLAARHFVMGLFKKKLGAKRQMGLAKGKWGAERQMWVQKGRGVPKRQMGRHKADGAP